MSKKWGMITGPHKGKLYRKFEVRTKGYVLTGHSTRLAARVALSNLRRKFKSSEEALRALSKRNWKPFNER